MSYTKDFSKIFANISIFPLVNLEVTLILVFVFRTIDFMLLDSFLSKSIMVLICLFLKASSNFVSIFLVSFLFFNFLSFFSRASSASHSSFFLTFYCCYPCISKRVIIFYLSKTLLEGQFNFLFQ